MDQSLSKLPPQHIPFLIKQKKSKTKLKKSKEYLDELLPETFKADYFNKDNNIYGSHKRQ